MKKVVSATLAGALAVGMVPAMALADEGVDLLATGPAEDFTEGTVVEFQSVVDIDGNTVRTTIEASDSVEFIADGAFQGVRPLTVMVNGEKVALEYSGSEENATAMYYKANKNGAQSIVVDGATVKVDQIGTSLKAIETAGTYYAVATVTKGTYKDGTAVASWTILPTSLDGTFIADRAAWANGVVDTELEYTGAAQDIRSYFGDKQLTSSEIQGAAYYQAGVNVGYPVNAGSYTYVFEGKTGTKYEGYKGEIAVEVAQLDLGSKTFVVEDVKSDSFVNYADAANLDAALAILDLPVSLGTVGGSKAADVAIQRVSGPTKNGAAGTYTYMVMDANVNNSNVIGSQTFSFDVYGEKATIQYGADVDTDGFADKAIDLSKAAEKVNLFDVAKISVTDADDKALGYEISVVDLLNNNAKADVADINTAGKWGVTIKVVDPNGVYGGTAYAEYDVTNDVLDPAKNVYVKYNGKSQGGTITHYWNGEDALDSIEITVKTPEGKVLEQGVDYQVKIEKAGKAVDEAVAVGSDYEIVITSETYDMSNADLDGTPLADTVQLDVVESTITGLRIAEWGDYDNVKNDTVNNELPYTKAAIPVTLEYTTAQMVDANGDPIYKALPAEFYTLTHTYSKDGIVAYAAAKEIKNVGFYKTTAKLTVAGDKCFDIASGAKTVDTEVTDYSVFDDVKAGAWYFDVVNDAKEAGLVNGISGTNLYAPEKAIKRGDFVCILFNMANAGNQSLGWASDENSYNENTGFNTGFNDVNGKAYWAEAIAWANKAGVANGHDGDFRPNDPIKRQEAIALVANYAEAMGLDMDVDADAVLAAYPDGAKVSGWAKDVVAWACDNDIAGNGAVINPLGNINRAEAAAVVYNFYAAYVK